MIVSLEWLARAVTRNPDGYRLVGRVLHEGRSYAVLDDLVGERTLHVEADDLEVEAICG